MILDLAPYNYVVQRNWEGNQDHPDLDLFVSDEDYEVVVLLTKELGYVDVRRPSDNYYPQYISDLLLVDKREWNGWKIPSPKAYFLSLYYHATVHKSENKYQDELKRAFLEWIPPVKADDPGVGYYIDGYYRNPEVQNPG